MYIFINNLNKIQPLKSYEANDKIIKKDTEKEKTDDNKHKKNKKKYKNSDKGNLLDTKI